MAFIRVKTRQGRRYAYLVESVWEPEAKTPRQRVLKYLGPADAVKPTDVPARHRKEPAVARWLLENAAEAQAAYEATAEAYRASLRAALLAPDAPAVDRLTRAALDRMGAWGVLEDVVTPLMRQIGEDWYEERVSVVDEHLVTRGVGALIRQARDASTPRGARHGRLAALLANPEGEMHSLALEVLECRLLAEGHRATVVPGGAPRRDVAARAKELDADLVLVSATLPKSAPESMRVAEAVLDRCPRALVLLGGQAWTGGRKHPTLDPRIRIAQGPTGPFLDAVLAELLERATPAQVA